MNDDEKELLKAGADAAMRPFANLMERLFGGAVDEVGGMWQDSLKVRRANRRVKLLQKLQAQIDDAGFDPQPIPDSIWIPILQEASLQDDEDLQTVWASQLANAADPRQSCPVTAPFASMLRELTVREVKFLDALYDIALTRNPPHRRIAGIEFQGEVLLEVYSNAGLSRQQSLAYTTLGDWNEHGTELQADLDDFSLTMDLLKRNRILNESVSTKPIDVSSLVNKMGMNRPPRVPTSVEIPTKVTYSFTQLGALFVSACRPPAKSEGLSN